MQRGEHRFNFSYSGLKTAVLNLTRQLEKEGIDPTERGTAAEIAAEFQAAAVDVLVEKTADAAQEFGARQVCICGGVSANRPLRLAAQERFARLGIPLRIPAFALCTDNAAMIGAAAYFRQQQAGLTAYRNLGVDVYASLPLT